MTDTTRPDIDDEFVPARAVEVYVVELDGEAVLLDEREERLHLLNHSAALLWLCFDGHATVRQLAVELSEELGAPFDVVLADTVGIVAHLADEGLLAHPSRADPS